ncbi:hypothetical protein LOD99_10647 [Oopsacas minuta]|uniref:Tc1-like transposase DDE domain-containing protein n=1 Tax=Oopsacas minuta TaxID=111878 RepID=A0AAV7KEM0_9METZ|nr:hypothetical protein LOD99_10647 [Oopsacas minuta]
MTNAGRPRSVTTQRLKKVLRERIRRNPRRSMRKMASELKISRRSIGRVVKRDLEMRSFKRKRVHHLSVLVKGKRVTRSKGLLNRHAIHGLESFVFTDEKLFTIEDIHNPQKDRIISSSLENIPEELRYVSRIQKPLSVMDGAPAHTSNATQAWFRSNNPNFIRKEEWPPYSPDLNPWTIQSGQSWKQMPVQSLTLM